MFPPSSEHNFNFMYNFIKWELHTLWWILSKVLVQLFQNIVMKTSVMDFNRVLQYRLQDYDLIKS